MAARKAFVTAFETNNQRANDYQKKAAEHRNEMQKRIDERDKKIMQKVQERSTGTSGGYSWTGKSANQMNTLEKTAYLRSIGNNDTARAAFSALSQEMQTVGSRHYSPYLTGKSNQKEAMEFFGLNSFDQNWLDENRFLLNYTTQLDQTDTISTSGQKKWSQAQWAGYYYQMLSEAEKTTQAAENEWAQLRSSMQQNFNEYKRLYGEAPSYEKLMSYIDMGDYSTLQKMDKVYENVEDLVRLNRSVEYTPETMVGVYASLLNGKDVTGEGDWFEEAVQYTMKPVQQPKQQEERADYAHWSEDQIEAKRQEIRRNGTRADLAQFEADLYASTPHLDSVDSQSYFKESYYDQNFLDKYSYLGDYAEQLRNRDGKIENPAAGDPWWYHAAYEYSQIEEREEATRKAEEEWTKLRSELKDYYTDGDDPEITMAAIDWDDYPTLKKIKDGKDIDLNRAVYFSEDAVRGALRAIADGEDIFEDDFDYAFYQTQEKAQEEPEKTSEEQEAEVKQPVESSTYFSGPSAYEGRIEGIDYDVVPEEEKSQAEPEPEEPYQFNPEAYFSGPAAQATENEPEPDIQEPPTGMNPEDFEKEEPYQFNPDAYFSGPSAQAAEEPADTEEVKQERQSFIDNLWRDMTANTKIDATMIEKQFYEAQGRPMTQEERVAAGLTPRSLEGFDPRSIQLGVMDDQKQSIFDDTYNSIAQRYDYENMDELIANDPALLSNMLDYIETEPRPQNFSTEEVEHLKLLKQYQDDLENGTLDEMFRAYADANATDEDRLNSALQYIIESGLTLEEKGALGLLNNDESMELLAERADKLFGENGSEMTKAMAISILGTDANEGAIKVVDAALSHLFAAETGVVAGLENASAFLPRLARDLWAGIMNPIHANRLGTDYTFDQACEIDPVLRMLTAGLDKLDTFGRIAAPDVSNFSYGASVTRFLVEERLNQQFMGGVSANIKPMVSSLFDKIGLNSNTLSALLGSDSIVKRAFGRVLDMAMEGVSGTAAYSLRNLSNYADIARSKNASESKALGYGIFMGLATGTGEGLIDGMYDAAWSGTSSGTAAVLKKMNMDGLLTMTEMKGVDFTSSLLRQALSESAEEIYEAVADRFGSYFFLGDNLSFTADEWADVMQRSKEAFGGSLLLSLTYGFTQDRSSKAYTDSELLAERIVSGKVTVDQMMEYTMFQAAENASTSDIESVLSMTTPGEKVDPDAEPEENRYSINDLLGGNKAGKTKQKTESELKIISGNDKKSSQPALIPNMAENGYVAPEIRDQAESSYAVRDSVRIMHEQQAAMDEAAIDMAAEEVVEQQIAEGAMDDLIGPASPNAKTIATHEVNLQTLMQKAQYEVEQMELLDKQKEAAIYTIISNGLSPEKGAARQTIHNFDEAKAAAQRRYDEWNQKLMDEENALQLERDHIQAQVDQRHKEMLTAARADVQQRWEQAKQKAEQLVIEMDSQKTEPKNAEMAVTTNPELAEGSLADQIIGVETGEDPYDYFSAKEKSGETVSQTEANRIAHHAGTDIQPDVELDSGDGDGYWPIDGKQKMLYEAILQEFPNEGWHFDKASLFKTEWDGDNRDEDPIADLTNRALVTVAKTADDEYILVKDTEKANQQGTDGAYLLLKKPDFSHSDDSAINKEAQHIMDAMDIRLNELSGKADQLKEQGIYGVDIDQTEERINALRKLRQQASSFILSGRHRALVVKLNNLIARENDNRIGTQEVRKILESIPQSEETSFSLDDYVVGRYGKQNEAMHAITQMEKGVRKVSHGKPTTKVSIDLLNAIPDPEQFMHEMKYGDFDIEEFAAANPKLFGESTGEVEVWTSEDLSQRYDSKLAHDNPNYTVIDNSNGFNLVVKSNRVRLDPNDTGRREQANLGIHTVSDAIQAIQKQLTNAQKSMEIEEANGQVREHDPMRLIYTVYDENGQPVNKTYQDYVDPTTGQSRIPTVRELLADSSRITVNWPRKWVQLTKGGKWVVGEKLEFTLERSDLSPNAYDPRDPNASRILVQAELRRAEKDYEDRLGSGTPSAKLRYFTKVCEANINSYLQAINQLSMKIESGNITDAELDTARATMTECYESLQTWQYAADRVVEAQDAQSNEHSVQIGADKIMKVYDGVLKKIGHASLDARLKLTAKFKKAMDALAVNELMAAMPKGATIETLAARYQELQGSLADIMNARNQAAVLNHHSPSALNSEPLAQAIMEEQNLVRQQMQIVADAPETLSGQQEQASDQQADTVAVYNEETPVEAPAQPTNEVSENAEDVTVTEAEEPDPVTKQQEMDRAYLGAIIGEEDANFASWYDNEELEARENQHDLIDADTGEVVSGTEQVTGSEYVEADTGEVKQTAYPDVSAEDMSYATPVEEFMERAGLSREYPAVAITSPEAYDTAEKASNDAHKAVQTLTDRINSIQTALGSEVFDDETRNAIQAEKLRYIDERNRIKREMNRMNSELAGSEYIGERAVRNIARHCLESGDVDWEKPLVRSKDIAEIRKKEIAGIKERMSARMRGGQLTALTLEDVAYILGTDDMKQTLKQRNQVAWEIRRQMRDISDQVTAYEAEAENIRQQNEHEGETSERMTRLARIDEYLITARGWLDNGQKAMRMYFDSGSELNLVEILKGANGGKLPLPVMNRLYAMLQDAAINRKGSTNRKGIVDSMKNPLQAVEDFTGEYAPIFNAIYISPVLTNNAKLSAEKTRLMDQLKEAGITAENEEIAFRYAEGKIDEVQFEALVPDPNERARIRYGAEIYHRVYEQLFEEVNAALKRNGFEEIKHRNNYVHHMSDAQGMIAKACSLLGIHISDDTLPTNMAGQTEDLKPRRKHMTAAMERHGDETSYKLRRNTMSYIESALRVIHQTDNISRLRQFEGYSVNTENKAAVYSGLRQFGELTRSNEHITDKPSQAYSTFATWVSNYTDSLAGKKTGKLDRAVEEGLGRNVLQVINGIKRYTGASMTAYNMGVAASNILSLATANSVAPKETRAALMETIHAFRENEVLDFEAKSSFLTARFEGKGMNLNWFDEFMSKGYAASEAVDRFAAHAVVRTFYKVGRDKGWTDSQAIKWADQMALRIMGSRNVGEGANIMNGTVEGALLQFSREGINNLQFLIHDLPKYHDGDKKKTWMSLMWLMIANFLYNGLMGKDTALEPITPTVRSVREWDPDKSLLDNAKNTAGNYAEMLNPTNIGTGGAYGDGLLESVPVVSAVKDLYEADDMNDFISASLGFVPGGRTAEKMVGGVRDLLRGYSTDKEGNIKYVLRTDEFSAGSVFDVIATIMLGSTSSIGGRAYKADGYDAMTKTQTEAFHSEKAAGMTNQEAFASVKGYAEQTGRNDASGMILPEWAQQLTDTDWMQAVREFGTGAYPDKAPDELSINGVNRTLTDEEKSRYDAIYAQVYQQSMRRAIANGENLHNAAEKARSTATTIFKKELEG